MEDPKNYISCCGFYCKTCKVFNSNLCKGCLLGYQTKERDINKAKCKIKLCCYQENKYSTCAECNEFSNCKIIASRFKPGTYQHKKCIQNLEFIRSNNTKNFIKIAKNWKNHYGKLK